MKQLTLSVDFMTKINKCIISETVYLNSYMKKLTKSYGTNVTVDLTHTLFIK